jgi:hypothetical protein
MLDRYITSRSTLISGTVVNCISGQPVPDVDVLFKEMNGSRFAARTDSQGHFTAAASEGSGPYLPYAAGPRFGTVMQAFFGRAVRGSLLFGGTLPKRATA